MQSRYVYSLRIILTLTDIALINLVFIFSFNITNSLRGGLPFHQYQQYLIYFNLVWLISAGFFRLYHLKTIQHITQIYRSTWKSISLHFVLTMFYFFIIKDKNISSTFFACFYLVTGVFFLVSRFICTLIETFLIQLYKIRKPVAVMGKNNTSLRLAAYFSNNNKQYSFEGFLNSDDNLCVDSEGNLLPSATEQLKIAAKRGIKEVYVSLTADRMGEAGHLIQEAEKQCLRLKFVPDFSPVLNAPFKINFLAGLPIIALRTEPLEEVQNRFNKRLFDIIFSSMVVLFLLSWLFPIIALIIKWQSPGPVLFRQLRSGRNNETFWCYKFRSMKVNPESDRKQASKNDDRITPIGKFMRKTSIDELPQFLNVLLGNMSVVGPRPHMLKHTEQYRAIIDKYMVRHYLKPGITGWAQVNGYRGETNSLHLMEKRVEHDIWYLENWSLMLDIKIVFLTIINALKGEDNAY